MTGDSAEAQAGIVDIVGARRAEGMTIVTRGDGVTILGVADDGNPESVQAGLKALVGLARQPGSARRSWAVLGEMTGLGDAAITEHDRIGRLAVRLDVTRLVVVGTGRAMSAMHHGAVMEGSWGAEATTVPDTHAALTLLRAGLQPGDVVLAGLLPLIDALAADHRDDRR